MNWQENKKFLQFSHFRPMFDKAFNRTLEKLHSVPTKNTELIKQEYLQAFDSWLMGSELNSLKGLEAFPDRDTLLGVTHALDDLHIRFGNRLVVMEKEYAYHRRIRADIPQRTLASLQSGDVLVLSNPFPSYGDQHPEILQILERCLVLQIPVHMDSAWFGCLRGFEFDFSHPAIQSVSFSLSKGLGLGSHRSGVRYSRQRPPGPVTVINDFNMLVVSSLWVGMNFMKDFGSDYLQNRYGEAYEHVCGKLDLRPTKTIHVAIYQDPEKGALPVGIRPFLRYLVDGEDEFK